MINWGWLINQTLWKMHAESSVLVDYSCIVSILCGTRWSTITIWQCSFYVDWLIRTHYHSITNLIFKVLAYLKTLSDLGNVSILWMRFFPSGPRENWAKKNNISESRDWRNLTLNCLQWWKVIKYINTQVLYK